jgi:2-dehydropantoate 2-reductase
MQDYRMAVIGIGATGTVLAAALLSRYPDTLLIGRTPNLGEKLRLNGINVSGEITYNAAVKNYSNQIEDLKDFRPSAIFLATKTFHLEQILGRLQKVVEPGIKIIATQNGLGPEDLIADKFFNRPHYLGSLSSENQGIGAQIAAILTGCGLDTEFVDDIQLFVWKKMIMKCTMASICAVTDRTIKDALEYPPTREIADACFKEALAVAKAMGYDIGEDYFKQALGYLEKVGVHKDSMCVDIANQTPTEIDFLGAKVVEYARARGISTPVYVTMTNLVKALESNYLEK